MADDPKKFFEKIDKLKSDRGTWETHWQDVTNYVTPDRNEVNRIGTPGEKRNLLVYDSTAIQACELLAGFLHGMLTNPSTFFFELFTGIDKIDSDDVCRKWLQDAAHTMHEILNNSNFQTEIHQVYMDLISIGTALLSLEEDDDMVVRFKTQYISRYYIEENEKGFVDKTYIKDKWKPQQVISEFAKDKMLPPWVVALAQKEPDCDIEVAQHIYPREDFSLKAMSSDQLKFASCYYIRKDHETACVRESGFRTNPNIVPRWTKGTGENYGRSPSMKVLPDIKMINEMMKAVIRAAQKQVDPPLLVPDDSVLGSIRTTPGALNFYRGGSQDFIKPLETGSRFDLGYQVMEDVRKRIRDGYYLEQLQMAEGPQKTATEVVQITEEKTRFLGPILGRQSSELLQQMIERLFDICERKKAFDPMPSLMVTMKPQIRVKYKSMLAQAQQMSDVNNVLRAFQIAQPFFQLDQNLGDLIDSEAGIRFIAQKMGLPVELLRSMKDIAKIKQARAETQQKMLQQQQQQQQVDNVAKVAPAVQSLQQQNG